MENTNRNHGFLNGLIIGLAIGFCLALLVSTEKGRKILKALTDEGMDNIEVFKKRLKKVEMDIDREELATDYYDTDEVATEDVPKIPLQKPVIHHQTKQSQPHANGSSTKHPVKRFFKGTKKS